MKNNFKIIIYILPFILCSFLYINSFASDSGFAFGSDVLTGANGSANINSLLGDTYSFESLYSPGFVIGISNAYDELNNQLYDRFGWDLDDAGQKIIDVASGGGDELGLTLNILAQTVNSPATDILSGGYQLFQFVRSGGAKSLVLGLADQANTTLEKIKGTILNQVTSADISNITSSISDMVSDNDIFASSDCYFSSSFYTTMSGQTSSYTYVDSFTFTLSAPVFFYTTVSGSRYQYHYVVPCTIGTRSCSITGNFHQTRDTSEGNHYFWDTPISFNPSSSNFICTASGYDWYHLNTYATNKSLNADVSLGNLSDITSLLNSGTFVYSGASYYDYVSNAAYERIKALLDSLKGHWVSAYDMASIRDLLSGGLVSDFDGAISYEYDGVIADSLADIIDDILDKSQVIEGELEGVISDSGTADPDDPDSDDDTGISVPPDYPTSTFDTLNDVISSPLEFFSIFEPIFLIFGSNALMIFGMWLFVPCVLIIAFIIWALK